MRILITGASGFIGFNLAKKLHDDGHNIVACVRRPELWQEKISAFQWLACDFSVDNSAAVWLPRLQGIDLVINAVGIIAEQDKNTFSQVQTQAPVALFSACAERKLRVIQISAMGADKPQLAQEFLRSKQQADNALWSLPVECVIAYPSIVIGSGGQSTALFNQLAAAPITPLVGDGGQRLNPIHIDDLCLAIAHIVNYWPGGRSRQQLSGSETLTMRELYTLLRDWLRLGKPCFVALPMGLMYSLAALTEFLRIPSILSRDALTLLQEAATPSPTYTACLPLPLSQRLWLQPATLADTTQAVWSGIKPALFAAVAFIWFFTALTSAFFDRPSGYALMAAGGISGPLATLAIYGGSIFDLSLGISMCIGRYRRATYRLQIILMLIYMVAIIFIVPEQWLHPFGPVTKNFPLIVATWLLLATERKYQYPHLKAG